MVEEGPVDAFQTQSLLEDLHEQTKPSLLVEKEKDTKLNPASHSNPYLYEDYDQQEEDLFTIVLCLL